MGGLSFNRLRLQGKIEGNVNKLRKEIEIKFKDNSPPVSLSKKKKGGGNGVGSDSAPFLKKRTKRRFESDDEEEWVDVEDEESDDDDEIEFERTIKDVKRTAGLRNKRRFVRKLADEFDSVVSDDLTNGGGVDGVALQTRSRRSVVLMDGEDEGGDVGDKSKVGKKKGGVENGKAVSKKTGKGSDSVSGSPNGFDSAPPAPILKKRTLKRFESEDDKEVKRNGGLRKMRKLVRKLGDAFDSVLSDDLSNGGGVDGVVLRTRNLKTVVLMDDDVGNKSKVGKKKTEGKGMGSESVSGSPNGSRTSPRLKKGLN